MYNKTIVFIFCTDEINKCITYLNITKKANFYFMKHGSMLMFQFKSFFVDV